MIKRYDDFISEELNIKKVIAGAALLGTLACNNSNTTPIEVGHSGRQTEQTPQSLPFDSLPTKFRMTQKLVTIGMDMNISDTNGTDYGIIEQRTMSLANKFELKDSSGKLIASAREKILSLYTDIEIKDENGKLIGSVEQELMESLFSIYSIYSIKDANGKVVAKSEKLDLFTSTVNIYDNSGTLIVAMDKDFISFGDDWDVSISNIDKRLVAFIPAFISKSQQDKKDEEDDKE